MKVLHIKGKAPLFTNTFLLLDEAGVAAVIDPAAPAQEYLEQLEKHGAKLTHILMTHGHYDHVPSVQELREKTGAKVYMNMEDACETRLLPLAKEQIDACYQEGEIIQIGKLEVQAIATPGHTEGSVCLLCDGMMFSGDTLFAGTVGRTDLETSNPQKMCESLRKLCAMIPEETEVFPGHEEFTTMGKEKKTNRTLLYVMNQ